MNKSAQLTGLLLKVVVVVLLLLALIVYVFPIEELIDSAKKNAQKYDELEDQNYEDFQLYDPSKQITSEDQKFIGSFNALVDAINAVVLGLDVGVTAEFLEPEELQIIDEEYDMWAFRIGWGGNIEFDEGSDDERLWGFMSTKFYLNELKGKTYSHTKDSKPVIEEGIKKTGEIFVPADYFYGRCDDENEGGYIGYYPCGLEEGKETAESTLCLDSNNGEGFGTWNAFWMDEAGFCIDEDDYTNYHDDWNSNSKYLGENLYSTDAAKIPAPIRDIVPLVNIRLTTYNGEQELNCNVGTNGEPDNLNDFLNVEKYNDLRVWGMTTDSDNYAWKKGGNCVGAGDLSGCDRDHDGIRGSYDMSLWGLEFSKSNPVFAKDFERMDAYANLIAEKIMADEPEATELDAYSAAYGIINRNLERANIKIGGKVGKDWGENCEDSPTFVQCPGIRVYYCGKWGWKGGVNGKNPGFQFYQKGSEWKNLDDGKYHARAGAKFRYVIDPFYAKESSSKKEAGKAGYSFRDAESASTWEGYGKYLTEEVNVWGFTKAGLAFLGKAVPGFGLAVPTLSTSDVFELDHGRISCQGGAKEDMFSVPYGGATVACTSDGKTCSVCDFELPQADITEEYEIASKYIAGYGDPKYLIYYEHFPAGEEQAWVMDVHSASLWTLAAINFGLNAVPVIFKPLKTAKKFAKLFKSGSRGSARIAAKMGSYGAESGFTKFRNFYKSFFQVQRQELKAAAKKGSKEAAEKVVKLSDDVIDSSLAHGQGIFNTLDGPAFDQLDEGVEELLEMGAISGSEGFEYFLTRGGAEVLEEAGEQMAVKNPTLFKQATDRMLAMIKVADNKAAIGSSYVAQGVAGVGTAGAQVVATGVGVAVKHPGAVLKTGAKAGAAYLLASTLLLEDSKNEKFFPIGLNKLGVKSPYRTTWLSGDQASGIRGLVDEVKPYHVMLKGDTFEASDSLVTDQGLINFYLASPCKADMAVQAANEKCWYPVNEGVVEGTESFFFEGTTYHQEFSDIYSIEKIKVGNVEKEVVFLKNGVFDSDFDVETAFKSCTIVKPDEQEDYLLTMKFIDQDVLKISPVVLKTSEPNFCFSGAHPYEEAMQKLILIRTLAVDLTVEIIADSFAAATAPTGIGPVLFLGAKSLIQTANDIGGAIEEQKIEEKMKWPRH